MLISRLTILLLLCGLALAAGACKTAESAAQKTVDQYMKSRGARDVKPDFFYTDSKFPDKAYLSATITHNFASSDGNFKKENLGFILNRDGSGWQVERITGHTTRGDEASAILSGQKMRPQS
ncbi:MAG: hypothetical protein AABO41_10305 [Acidobacteriota bacterium]